jgi:hypothetical protein
MENEEKFTKKRRTVFHEILCAFLTNLILDGSFPKIKDLIERTGKHHFLTRNENDFVECKKIQLLYTSFQTSS